MIAVDSTSMIAYLEGEDGPDVRLVDQAFEDQHAALPPAALTELLSAPRMRPDVRRFLLDLPRLEITDGYWERAADLRATVIGRRRRARLGDALIAQSCLDAGTALITRDRDFQAFARIVELRLA